MTLTITRRMVITAAVVLAVLVAGVIVAVLATRDDGDDELLCGHAKISYNLGEISASTVRHFCGDDWEP
jgi:hypothetical protein